MTFYYNFFQKIVCWQKNININIKKSNDTTFKYIFIIVVDIKTFI